MADNGITAVFSKSYCPYCKSTKSLLSEMGANFYTIELDQEGTSDRPPTSSVHLVCKSCNASLTYTAEDGQAIQDYLADKTGQRSVPNIFIKGSHIGGNSDLQAKKKELPQLLKSAGAL